MSEGRRDMLPTCNSDYSWRIELFNTSFNRKITLTAALSFGSKNMLYSNWRINMQWDMIKYAALLFMVSFIIWFSSYSSDLFIPVDMCPWLCFSFRLLPASLHLYMASLLLLLLFLLLPLLQTDVLSHHLQRNLIYLDSQVRTYEFTPFFLQLIPKYFYEALELLNPHFFLDVTSVSSFINATLWSCLLFFLSVLPSSSFLPFCLLSQSTFIWTNWY